MGATSSPADDMAAFASSLNSPLLHQPISMCILDHITLPENGMIVEHVDVRKEEREARERKRKEENVQESLLGVLLWMSLLPFLHRAMAHSPITASSHILNIPIRALFDHECFDRLAKTPRLTSSLFTGFFHSLGSGSPRRTRCFGIRNPSAGWMSQDNLAHFGMSGSMVDRQ
jgi:hypothetical protein